MKFIKNCLKASIFSDYSGDMERMLGQTERQKKNTLFGGGVGAASAPKLIIELFTLSLWIHVTANRCFGKQ